MFGHIKDFIAFCLHAGSRMQEKSEDFSRKRKQRMQEFRAGQRPPAQEPAYSEPHVDTPKTWPKNRNTAEDGNDESVFATTEDIKEIKTIVNALQQKVELLAKQQPSEGRE